jgi:general secretion pathway protein J
LLEVLVGLVILAGVAGVMAGGLGGARRVLDRGDARQQAEEALESAQATVRLRLERARAVTRRDASRPYADFTGTADTVEFLAPPPATLGPGALRRTTLQVGADGNLILSSTNSLWRKIARPPQDEVLLRDVQSLEVAYFGEAPPEGRHRWQSQWRHRPVPPDLVRIRVRFAAGDGRWWPDLMIRPMATIDSDCVLDVKTGGCRGR